MGNIAVKGYLDIFGKHGAWIGDHSGPAAYVTGGEVVAASQGGQNYNASTSIITGIRSLGRSIADVAVRVGHLSCAVAAGVETGRGEADGEAQVDCGWYGRGSRGWHKPFR